MKFSTMRNFSLRKISSGRLVNPSQDWQNICRFLESGEYGRAAVSFQQLQDNFKGTAREELTIILSAAMQICLACAQLKLEEQRCRDAIQDMHQREQALQAELGELVRQMMDWEDGQALSSNKASGLQSLKFVQGTVQKKFLQRLWGPKQMLDEENRVEDPMVSFSARAEEEVLPTLPEAKRPEELHHHQLFIFCLGVFQVYLDGKVGVNWPNSKGKSIFKYLVTHKEQPVAKEVLMELFWRDSSPDSARRNLNWSIHSLRQALHRNQPDFSHVEFESECYRLNPDLQIWMDVDEFKAHLQKAQGLEDANDTALAMSEYQAAEILYQGEFLEEDRYEDWIFPLRQSLQNDYLSLLERLSNYYYENNQYDACVNLCNKMISTDPCREEAHFRLMQCYRQQGFPYLAIRQYHKCVEKLKSELDVPPSPKTTALMDEIRRG